MSWDVVGANKLGGVNAAVPVAANGFDGVEQAIVVAKGNTALLSKVQSVIEDTRASGFIAAAIARAGLVGVDVAPPRAR